MLRDDTWTQWAGPLVVAADVVVGAAWQLGPLRVLAGLATWRTAEIINEGSIEVMLATHSIGGAITDEAVGLTHEIAWASAWVFRAVCFLFLLRVMRWGSEELGKCWATLWGYRDNRRPTPYAQAQREENSAKGAGSSADGAEPSRYRVPASELARRAKKSVDAEAAARAASSKSSSEAVEDLSQRFSKVRVSDPSEPGPASPWRYFHGSRFPLDEKQLVGLDFSFVYPRGSRADKTRRVKVLGVIRAHKAFPEWKIRVYDYDVAAERTYFEHLCTAIVNHERHPGSRDSPGSAGSVDQDTPRWWTREGVPEGPARPGPEELEPVLAPNPPPSSSALGAGSSARGAVGETGDEGVEVVSASAGPAGSAPLQLALGEPFLLALNDDGVMRKAISLVIKARTSVLCSWYTFDELDLCEALKASAARVDVRMILDRGQQVNAASSNQNHRVVSVIEAGGKVRMGASTAGRHTVHQKALLVDGLVALFGSGNATGHSRDHCYEFGVVCQDVDLVGALSTKLEALWDKGTPLPLATAQEYADSKERKKAERRGASQAK